MYHNIVKSKNYSLIQVIIVNYAYFTLFIFRLIQKMLIRDPSKRATLRDVLQSPWVIAGDRGHAEALPLVFKDHLPESAHATIVEQMVAGGIETEDYILK